jgi:hypothetical protein
VSSVENEVLLSSLKGDECSTFTDGAGVCGEDIARRAAHALGFRTGIHSRPSAIQVRYGGCKGVLSVSPEVKPADVRIRPSMEKFKSPDKVMNVVRVSPFTTDTLRVKACGDGFLADRRVSSRPSQPSIHLDPRGTWSRGGYI